jgi:two-component system sensor histidine kinase VicK
VFLVIELNTLNVMPQASPQPIELPFLQGGGECGEIIRETDWSRTPLGAPQSWEPALKISVGILLSSPFPMHITWGAEFIQFYNDGYRPILGSNKHPQAMGIPIWRSFSEIWDTIGPMFHGVMEGHAVRFTDFKLFLNRNGYSEECYFNFAYSPIKDETGNIRGVITNVIETTDKVRAFINNENAKLELEAVQAETASQRDRFAQFFMQAPAGICVLNGPDYQFELVNPLYQQFFPGRDILGKPLTEAIPELAGQPIIDIIENVYRTGKLYEGRELYVPMARMADGFIEERYFNFIYQPRPGPGDQVDGIFVFAIEVTDTVLARRKIEASANLFRTQLNAIPQIAWTNTLDGEVDFYNQQWYNYTGLDEKQFSGRDWETVIHHDDLDYCQDSFRNILRGTTGGEFEIREKRADGEYRWHLVRILPIKNEQGALQSWIGTATDIHDLKMLAAQKDDFICIASHELKTPVTSLKSSLQLLDRMKEQPSPVMLPRLIVQANRSVEKISGLIEELLDASKLNQNQLHIVKKKFKVSEMLEGSCNHVRAAGKHELIFKGDPELTIFADEHRIDQVVVNFVNNAVKYAPESKQIYLIVAKMDQYIKVSVKDNGPGISPDKIPHLFNKYYRAEYFGAQYSGLGLGLYISAEIIHRHNGEIGVDSQLGKGSTFWFTLPLSY